MTTMLAMVLLASGPDPAATVKTGLPPVTTTVSKAASAARKLNSKGLKAHRKKDYAAAAASYEAAVRKDPSHILARYNLACAWNRLGKAVKARAVLWEFQRLGCDACLARLIKARQDKDFQGQWKDPHFIALTAKVTVKTYTLKQVGEAVSDAFELGKTKRLRPMLHHRERVTVVIQHSIADEGDSRKLYGRDALLKYITKTWKNSQDWDSDDAYGLEGLVGMTCKKDCCKANREEINHNTLFMEKVCVRREAGDRLTVKSIHFVDGD